MLLLLGLMNISLGNMEKKNQYPKPRKTTHMEGKKEGKK